LSIFFAPVPAPGIPVATTFSCTGVNVGRAVGTVDSGRHLSSDEDLASGEN